MTLERAVQASDLDVRHSDEPGARAVGKGTLAPVEKHSSRLLSVLLAEEVVHLNAHLLTETSLFAYSLVKWGNSAL